MDPGWNWDLQSARLRALWTPDGSFGWPILMMCRCVQNSSAEIRLPVAHDDMNQQEGNHSTLPDVVTPWRDLCHPLRSIAQESRPGASCLHASWQSMPPGPRRGWHFYDLAWWPLNVRTRGLLVWSPDMNSNCSTSPVCCMLREPDGKVRRLAQMAWSCLPGACWCFFGASSI